MKAKVAKARINPCKRLSKWPRQQTNEPGDQSCGQYSESKGGMQIQRKHGCQVGANGHEAHLGNGELPHRQGEIHAQGDDDVDTNVG